jgi:hypothetical protein
MPQIKNKFSEFLPIVNEVMCGCETVCRVVSNYFITPTPSEMVVHLIQVLFLTQPSNRPQPKGRVDCIYGSLVSPRLTDRVDSLDHSAGLLLMLTIVALSAAMGS